MTENLSIPVSAAEVREWINDARDLAYPLRTPSTDEAVALAVSLIIHLTGYLRQAGHSDNRGVMFPVLESESTWKATFDLPDICADLGGLCEALSKRFEDFSSDEALRLHPHHVEDKHPDLADIEAIGTAVAIADCYGTAAKQLRGVYELLADVRRTTSRITMKPAPAISEEGQR
ncbi:hypothetical protein ACFXPS_05580 [Nocardia sp. NPDC059091]|uniref:hypothetical protein n=1 Tax=unclassified Nocardia TaxID=2637762 RepID=UPI00368789F9